jgi:hypothetical protein
LRGYFNFARTIAIFILGQRNIATVDNKDHTQSIFFVGQVLGALKEENRSIRPPLMRSLNNIMAAFKLF